MFMSRCGLALVALCLSVQFPLAAGRAAAPGGDIPSVLASCCSEMRWRMIGPFRAGRTKAAAGIPDQPNVFYIGVVQRRRLEDDRLRPHLEADLRRPADRLDRRHRRRAVRTRTSSTSAAAKGCSVPTSPPATASTSRPTRGKTWTHLGLRDGQQIPQIVVDPRDPEPAVRRRARPSVRPERRARRLPLDRRRRDVREGALQGREHRRDRRRPRSARIPHIVYAVLWEARQAPWENGAFIGPGSGLFKSTDGGTTWRPADAAGLPTFAQDGLGRIGIDGRAERSDGGCSRRSKRDAARRPLPLGRRRRELGTGQRPTRAVASAAATSPR